MQERDGAAIRRTTLLSTGASGALGTALATTFWGGGGLLAGLVATGGAVAIEWHANPDEYAAVAQHLGPACTWVARGLRRMAARRLPRPHDAEDEQQSVVDAPVRYRDYIQSDAWRNRADAIRKRDGHRCQECGAGVDYAGITLDVHHLTYERLGHEEDEDLV